jgi:hypothetical protein
MKISSVSCCRHVGDRKTKINVLVYVCYCRGVGYSNGNNCIVVCAWLPRFRALEQ